jgi:Transposase DDE domain
MPIADPWRRAAAAPNDTAHLSNIAGQSKAALGVEKLEVIADRGYFDGEEILACDQADITVTLPKPQRSGAKSEGRFGQQDFVYLADVFIAARRVRNLGIGLLLEEHGQKLRRYWTDACGTCPIKAHCTTGKERRITRWEHEGLSKAVQERLDKNPDAMRRRRETVEHPFGTMKMRMGATHFLTKTLPKVDAEVALCVLTYNLTRVLNIVGINSG